MARAHRSVLSEGVVAGLVGAIVVALWFLVVDIARGKPLLTPALLGSALLYGTTDPAQVDTALGPVLAYTLVHGIAFLAVGILAASLIAMSEREPPLLVAFVILFAAFEVFFMGAVSAFGYSLVGALVWWAVGVANLLATAAMLWWLFRLHRGFAGSLVGSSGRVLGEGVVAGLIGAAVVAAWFFAIDTIHGEPLRTPALLGAAFLKQPTGPSAVLLYTVLHGIAFIGFGIVASFLVSAAERQPMFLFAIAILFVAFEVFFFGAVVVGARWLLDEVAARSILFANLFAAVAMLGFFFRRHRALAGRLAHAFADEE